MDALQYFTYICWFSEFFIVLISGECVINLDDLNQYTPILVNNSDILNSETNYLTLLDQETILLVCSGLNNKLQSINEEVTSITCEGDMLLLDLNDEIIDLRKTSCRKIPESTSRLIGTCNSDGTLIEIGYEINPTEFLSLILVCFNTDIAQTYWTKHHLKSTGYCWKQKNYKHFETDFFDSKIHPVSVYKANKYRLDKGHLCPKGDFYTAVEKRMTYYFINVAPQIKQFNHENWRKLEEIIRNYSRNSRKNFYIYTGTHDLTEYLNGDNMPLVLYFWKVIIEERSGKGVAFIGVNDIDHTYSELCNDICHKLKWLNNFQDERQNWQDGHVYCCNVESFKAISEIKIPTFSEYRGGLP